METMRLHARRRFLFASAGFTLGSLVLSSAVAFFRVYLPVGGLTSLILGALLQVLGLAAAAYAALALARAFPLSEAAAASRRVFLASIAVVLPGALLGTYAWLSLLVRDPQIYVLIPALPLFWGPVSAFTAAGLVYAARELASERMAIVAAIGCGGVVAMALSASAASLVNPLITLESGRLAGDLFLVGLGFLAIAFSFERDASAARSRRAP